MGLLILWSSIDRNDSYFRESWENILLEMDTKLASYAKPNPVGRFLENTDEGLIFAEFFVFYSLKHTQIQATSKKGVL